MKSLSCKDLGDAMCPFTASGETAAEVKQKLWAHAKEVHMDKLEKMSADEKKQMEAKMDEMLA